MQTDDQQMLYWKFIIIIKSYTSGDRRHDLPVGSSNKMLCSNYPDMTVGHVKEFYSWERFKSMMTDRKKSKLIAEIIWWLSCPWDEETQTVWPYTSVRLRFSRPSTKFWRPQDSSQVLPPHKGRNLMWGPRWKKTLCTCTDKYFGTSTLALQQKRTSQK